MSQMEESRINDDIDLKEIINAVNVHRWFIIITVFIAGMISVSAALYLPNKYKSDTLVAPVSSDNTSALAGLASQFGGLASMAGINLSGGGDDKSILALEVLKSRKFLMKFVTDNNLAKDILAASDWDEKADQIIYDQEIYSNNQWVRSPPKSRPVIPTPLEVYEEFLSKNLRVSEDEDTGYYRIAVIHYSPVWAKDVLEKLMLALNQTVKQSDISEADKSIAYIEKSLAATTNADMMNVFFQLIEQQYQVKMLASVKADYVFKTVDPPIIAEEKDSPSRALICIIGVLLGGFLSVFISLVRYFWNK